MSTSQFLSIAQRLADMQIDDPEVFSVIHDLGEMTLTKPGEPHFDRSLTYQVEPVVARFLDSPDSEARRAALDILIYYWSLGNYIGLCKHMLLSDPDEFVRATAARCLGDYYRHSRDEGVIALLTVRSQDASENDMVREMALTAIKMVSD